MQTFVEIDREDTSDAQAANTYRSKILVAMKKVRKNVEKLQSAIDKAETETKQKS
jgi:hypothetical protein